MVTTFETFGSFLQHNMVLIFFGYGLAFFAMGIAIALQCRKHSSLRLSRSLCFLSVFGILHGLSEWGYIFIPVQAAVFDKWVVNALQTLHMVLLAGSFTFLFSFGVRLFLDTEKRFYWLKWVPIGLFVLWFSSFLHFRPHLPDINEAWLHTGEAGARYLLALPGSILSSYAILRQKNEFEDFGINSAIRHLRGASAIFAVYGVAAGVFVPASSFPPASVLNTTLFLRLIGFPVQVIRALGSVMIAYFVVRILEVFDMESARRLEELERQRAVLRERDRISRDLHDGIIQAIYAVGLNLENSCYLIDENPDLAKKQIRSNMERLNESIRDIRRYIMDLRPPESRSLRHSITSLADEFKSRTGLEVELAFKGIPAEEMPPEVRSNIYHIVREALANVTKHARASKVEIGMEFREGAVRFTIRDNGAGFNYEQVRAMQEAAPEKFGLRNMAERARLLRGKLTVNSVPGRGTEIALEVPYKAVTGEYAQDHAG